MLEIYWETQKIGAFQVDKKSPKSLVIFSIVFLEFFSAKLAVKLFLIHFQFQEVLGEALVGRLPDVTAIAREPSSGNAKLFGKQMYSNHKEL